MQACCHADDRPNGRHWNLKCFPPKQTEEGVDDLNGLGSGGKHLLNPSLPSSPPVVVGLVGDVIPPSWSVPLVQIGLKPLGWPLAIAPSLFLTQENLGDEACWRGSSFHYCSLDQQLLNFHCHQDMFILWLHYWRGWCDRCGIDKVY